MSAVLAGAIAAAAGLAQVAVWKLYAGDPHQAARGGAA